MFLVAALFAATIAASPAFAGGEGGSRNPHSPLVVNTTAVGLASANANANANALALSGSRATATGGNVTANPTATGGNVNNNVGVNLQSSIPGAPPAIAATPAAGPCTGESNSLSVGTPFLSVGGARSHVITACVLDMTSRLPPTFRRIAFAKECEESATKTALHSAGLLCPGEKAPDGTHMVLDQETNLFMLVSGPAPAPSAVSQTEGARGFCVGYPTWTRAEQLNYPGCNPSRQ